MISGIFTTLAFVMFLGVGYWAYSRHNRGRFDEAARLPFGEDHPSTTACATTPASPARRNTGNDAPCCCKEPRP
jgi:cytochrome c oxidase cbb3-type subunit 4